MKIIHVIPYFPPAARFGGVPVAVYQLAKAQAEIGNEITVLTTDAGLIEQTVPNEYSIDWASDSYLRAIGSFDRLEVWYFKNRFPALANRFKIFLAPFENPATDQLFDSSIDCLHFHEVHIPGYRGLALKAIRQGIRVCVSPHGSLAPAVHRGLKKSLHLWFDPYMRRDWFHHSHAYFSLCRHETEQLIAANVNPDRIHTIPHGRPEFLKKPAADSTLPFPFDPNPSLPTFLYLGRLSRAKGVFFLIDAIQQVWNNHPCFRFVLCGPDEGAKRYVQTVCERNQIPNRQNAVLSEAGVYFIDEIGHEYLPALFSKVDRTVCPSGYESFGLTPIESLSNHVPVIVTSAYGCLEHLDATSTMMTVVQSDQIEPLRQALESGVLNHPTALDRQPFHGLPTWVEIAQRYCRIYRERNCE